MFAMRVVLVASGFVLAALGFAACGGGGGGGSGSSPVQDGDGGGVDASAPEVATTSGPTFHKDIEPILQDHCQMCHVQGGIAPMALLTYADAQPFANKMAAKTGAREMPPWGAQSSADCTPPHGFKNDPSLTDAQIATFAAWAKAGAPEGDPKDAPPPKTPTPITLANPSVTLTPPAGFSTVAGGPDQFRCFVLDPKLAAATYVDGLFVEPGNRTIVHHVLVYTDDKRDSLAKVTDQATQSYDCFGGPGVSSPNLVAVWAPGTTPVEYPQGVAAQLAANTLLVMQVHYHPHSAQATTDPDRTKFLMRYASAKPSQIARTFLLGNFDFPVNAQGIGLLPGPNDPPTGVAFEIPPYAVGHTETMQFTMPATANGFPIPPLPILGVGGHEHYVGTQVKVTIHHDTPAKGQPQDECLLNIPKWDFNWQRGYQYDTTIDKLPTVAGKDVVHVKCTYNNSMSNPAVARSLAEQGLSAPRKVVLGETTLDEMCLAPIVILTPNL